MVTDPSQKYDSIMIISQNCNKCVKSFLNELYKKVAMKRIEATIQTRKLSAVADAISDTVGGFTVLEGRGRGSGKRQTVRLGRGTGSVVAEYNQVTSISTIVGDEDVDKVIEAISGAAYTGEAGDGIITVQDVINVTNISSKKSGNEAL